MIRISKVASEQNITSQKIIECLLEHFPEKKYTINQKLENDEIELIKKQFNNDLSNKFQRFKEKNVYLYEINKGEDEFDFTEKEIKKFNNLYRRYVDLITDVENLHLKKEKYWALEKDEIRGLLNIKFVEIHHIELEIKQFREDEQERIDKILEYNQSLHDLYIHQEARSIAQWNID